MLLGWRVASNVIIVNKPSNRVRFAYPTIREYAIQDFTCLSLQMPCKAVSYNANFNSKKQWK